MDTNKEEKIVNCICGEPHMNIEVFKEQGVWIALCHECDHLEYSSQTKRRVIEKWNKGIEKDRNTLHQSSTSNNEIYVGMTRWTHNVAVRWNEEHGEPMGEEDIDELVSLFRIHLEDIVSRL